MGVFLIGSFKTLMSSSERFGLIHKNKFHPPHNPPFFAVISLTECNSGTIKNGSFVVNAVIQLNNITTPSDN